MTTQIMQGGKKTVSAVKTLPAGYLYGGYALFLISRNVWRQINNPIDFGGHVLAWGVQVTHPHVMIIENVSPGGLLGYVTPDNSLPVAAGHGFTLRAQGAGVDSRIVLTDVRCPIYGQGDDAILDVHLKVLIFWSDPRQF